MRKKNRPPTVFAAAALVVAVSLSLVGCTNPQDGSERTTPAAGAVKKATKVDRIAAMVPKKYRSAGDFTVAVNPSSPPLKYLDDAGGFTGFAPDLINAAATVMGLKTDMQQTSFDALVPGLEAKRFDVILSINDFAERRAEIDFIDYLWAGTAIDGAKDLKQDSVTTKTLCGLTIGYARGNVQQTLISTASADCVAAGKPAVKGVGFQDINAALLAVKSKQLDAVWGDATSMAYNAKQDPSSYKVLYEEKSGPYGIGVNKQDSAFRDALRQALLVCVKDGIYQQLLDKYGLSKYALPKLPLNQGPSDGS